MANRSRGLSTTLLVAAHRACDGDQLVLAVQLLQLGETLIRSEADLRQRYRDMQALIAAHERLWHLRRGIPGLNDR